MLWQHLFWFFGHPEVYIVALPFFGIVTEVLPVFSRKPLFGYKGMVGATIAIAGLSMTVWAHHMFTTGAVLLPFFSFMTFLIAVPTGVKFFNWVGTMWRGQLTFEAPMLFTVGFLVTFLFGGLTGVILASPPLDFHVSDSYFVVAHFHYVLFGTVVFACSRLLLLVAQVHREDARRNARQVAFLDAVHRVQHDVPGAALDRHPGHAAPGTPAIRTCPPTSPCSTRSPRLGSFILGASTLFFLWNVYLTSRRPERVTKDDPWGYANSLEWATSCPPPRHNFTQIPRIRSERPAFDLHYPHIRSGRSRASVPAAHPEGGPAAR